MRAARLLLVAPLAVASLGVGARPAAHDAAWVDQRAAAWQPTAAERRWETIGWAADIRTAERVAAEHRRPVFLFTHDGRLDVGRC